MKNSDSKETTQHVTMATVVENCKTFSNGTYGDTVLHSKDSTHGWLDSSSSVAREKRSQKCSLVKKYIPEP